MKTAKQTMDESYEYIFNCYLEKHRYYHNYRHVEKMKNFIRRYVYAYGVSDKLDLLLLAADFHDCVYEPGATDNEERSVEKFMEFGKDMDLNEARMVCDLIMATKHPEKAIQEERTHPERCLFCRADWPTSVAMNVKEEGLFNFNEKPERHSDDLKHLMSELKNWEDGIFQECRKYPLSLYLKKRRDFLEWAWKNNLIDEFSYSYIMELLNRTYNIGVYAGSFNPFHKGHLDIFNKAKRLFDKVIVAKGVNPEKGASNTNIHELFPYEETTEFEGYLADYLMSLSAPNINVTLIRGLRNGYDLQYETNVYRVTSDLMKKKGAQLNSVEILCDPSLEHVSSSMIRSLKSEDQKDYVPQP